MTRTEARQFLEAAGIVDAATDARRLLEFAANAGCDATPLVQKRAGGTPISHILGYREFWKHRFKVTPDVLDPRPDTETLVELALDQPFKRILDLGTGSGCILISLLAERQSASGVGSDISEKALPVAEENAAAIDVADRVVFQVSDWFNDIKGLFDLIVSNPPYIAAAEMNSLQGEVRDHEPRVALTDEADGLTSYRRIAKKASDYLTPDGRVLVEIGALQGREVSALFRASGFTQVFVHPDLDGRDRVVSAQK